MPQTLSQDFAVDRRQRGRRFAIVASVKFSWTGSDGKRSTGRGRTRDISIYGAFIWAWPVPLPGTEVEVNVEVPALVTGGLPLRLHGSGTVLRVDPPDAQAHGFAIAVNFQTTGIKAMSSCGPANHNSPLS